MQACAEYQRQRPQRPPRLEVAYMRTQAIGGCKQYTQSLGYRWHIEFAPMSRPMWVVVPREIFATPIDFDTSLVYPIDIQPIETYLYF